MFRITLALTLLLSFCQGDQSVSGYAPGVWELVEMDGVTFAGAATLDLTQDGHLTGQAPCNNYSATQSAPYPWFDAGPIIATRRACPELDLETGFFAALADMTLAEVSGPLLLLNNTDGRAMLFQLAD
jgi:heat shock protein HslJ